MITSKDFYLQRKRNKMKNKEEKTKVTPQELGKVLCAFSYNMADKYLNEKETLKVLGIEKNAKNFLLKKYYFFK